MNFTSYKTVFQFHFCYFIQASSNRLAQVQRKRVETERLVESSSLYNLSTVFSETDYKNIDHVMENIKKNYSGVVKFRSLVSKDLWQKAKKARLRMDQRMVDDLFTEPQVLNLYPTDMHKDASYVDGEASALKNALFGLSQGLVLGPFLTLILKHKLPEGSYADDCRGIEEDDVDEEGEEGDGEDYADGKEGEEDITEDD